MNGFCAVSKAPTASARIKSEKPDIAVGLSGAHFQVRIVGAVLLLRPIRGLFVCGRLFKQPSKSETIIPSGHPQPDIKMLSESRERLGDRVDFRRVAEIDNPLYLSWL